MVNVCNPMTSRFGSFSLSHSSLLSPGGLRLSAFLGQRIWRSLIDGEDMHLISKLLETATAGVCSLVFSSLVWKGDADYRRNHPWKTDFWPLILWAAPRGIGVLVVELVITLLELNCDGTSSVDDQCQGRERLLVFLTSCSCHETHKSTFI
jgi:hypothetical protein